MRRLPASLLALICGCAAVAQPHHARSTDPEPLTVFVAIDDASAATLGAFPVDRGVYARAIEAAKALGAKGVALKFFFDRPGRPEADAALVEAAHGLPVLLQVQSAPETAGQGVPANLARDDWDLAATPQPLQMEGVELPIAHLAAAAHGLGFIDARPDDIAGKVEIAGTVQRRAIASLALDVVELASGRRAVVRGNRLALGNSSLALDAQGRFACASFTGTAPRRYGIDALLSGSIPRAAIEGKVVVVGYGRSDSPTVDIGAAKVPIHEAFYRQLACLAREAGAR